MDATWDMAETVTVATQNANLAAANRTIWTRVLRGGVANASKIALFVYTSSGNISVAVHRNSGTGLAAAPGVQVATSGAVACPAAGHAEIPISPTVPVIEGDWIAVSADNTTFSTLASVTSLSTQLFAHLACYGTGHPVPSTVPALTGFSRQLHLVAIP